LAVALVQDVRSEARCSLCALIVTWTPPAAGTAGASWMRLGAIQGSKTLPTIATIGMDTAKHSFEIHGVDDLGRPALRRRLGRGQVLRFFAKLPPCRIGMEACGGAHYWARELVKLGHDVRLMPAQYVRPYVKRSKHDAADAEACCEAVQRPSMRFVPVKSEAQQALLMLHRIRDRLQAERTGTINAIRGHMAEFGMVAMTRGRGFAELAMIIADVDDLRLPAFARELLAEQMAHLRSVESRIDELDTRLRQQARSDPSTHELLRIPGVGPVVATAATATVGDAQVFANGRSFAAWLGLVPRQHATGGRERLLGISKRGDGYLRRQLMHGARSLVRIAKGRETSLYIWINRLLDRRHFNVVVAAVANKLARWIWIVLARRESFTAPA
jgi:transposase